MEIRGHTQLDPQALVRIATTGTSLFSILPAMACLLTCVEYEIKVLFSFYLILSYVSCLYILDISPSLVMVVQLLSHVQLFATLWTAARQAFLSFTIS